VGADILRTRGRRSSDADVRTFWCKKVRIFSKFMVWPQSARIRRKGMLKQCGRFSGKGGRGQFFMILCGRFLWTAPKHKNFWIVPAITRRVKCTNKNCNNFVVVLSWTPFLCCSKTSCKVAHEIGVAVMHWTHGRKVLSSMLIRDCPSFRVSIGVKTLPLSPLTAVF